MEKGGGEKGRDGDGEEGANTCFSIYSLNLQEYSDQGECIYVICTHLFIYMYVYTYTYIYLLVNVLFEVGGVEG